MQARLMLKDEVLDLREQMAEAATQNSLIQQQAQAQKDSLEAELVKAQELGQQAHQENLLMHHELEAACAVSQKQQEMIERLQLQLQEANLTKPPDVQPLPALPTVLPLMPENNQVKLVQSGSMLQATGIGSELAKTADQLQDLQRQLHAMSEEVEARRVEIERLNASVDQLEKDKASALRKNARQSKKIDCLKADMDKEIDLQEKYRLSLYTALISPMLRGTVPGMSSFRLERAFKAGTYATAVFAVMTMQDGSEHRLTLKASDNVARIKAEIHNIQQLTLRKQDKGTQDDSRYVVPSIIGGFMEFRDDVQGSTYGCALMERG
eukprot:scaffold63900_cov39-Prasinocladus_malaysianus.AAC.1